MIRSLDIEYQKMQSVSQITEFMVARNSNHCSLCHEQINQIFDKVQETILNVLNKQNQHLHDNVNQFKQTQLQYIQNELQNVSQYQCEIRQTRADCNNILESQ
eukprot:331698_1